MTLAADTLGFAALDRDFLLGYAISNDEQCCESSTPVLGSLIGGRLSGRPTDVTTQK